MKVKISFTFRTEKDEEYVYAICDHAPLASHGLTEGEAASRMADAVSVYLQGLIVDGELEDAVKCGLVHLTVEADEPGAAGGGVRVERTENRFDAVLVGARS